MANKRFPLDFGVVTEASDLDYIMIGKMGTGTPMAIRVPDLLTNNKVYTYNSATEIAKIIPYYAGGDITQPYANSVFFAGYGFGNNKYKFYDGYCQIFPNTTGTGNYCFAVADGYVKLQDNLGQAGISAGPWGCDVAGGNGSPGTTLYNRPDFVKWRYKNTDVFTAYDDSTQLTAKCTDLGISRLFMIAGETGAAGAKTEYTSIKNGQYDMLNGNGLSNTQLKHAGTTAFHFSGSPGAITGNMYNLGIFGIGQLNTTAQDLRGAINELKAGGGGGLTVTKSSTIDNNGVTTSWYRKYSDGYIEQGGAIYIGDFYIDGTERQIGSVNFPQAFSRKPVMTNISASGHVVSFIGSMHIQPSSGTNLTSANIYVRSINGLGVPFGGNYIFWEAKGY